MARRDRDLSTGALERIAAVLLVAVLAAIGVGGLLAYGALADPNSERVQIGDRDMVLVELVGSQPEAKALVCRGVDVTTPETAALGPSLRPRGGMASCEAQVAHYQGALKADLLLIGCYLVSLGCLCVLGWKLFQTQRWRRVAGVAGIAVGLAAVLDLLENLLLQVGLNGLETDEASWVWRWAAAASITKFSLIVPAMVVAVAAALVIAGRAIARPADFDWLTADGDAQPAEGGPDRVVIPPTPVIDREGRLWPGAGGPALDLKRDLKRPPAEVGICLSGGGIRSGTVALGALDVLRDEGVLKKAGYLVSVSGGGYASGAWLLALQEEGPPEPPAEGAPEATTVRDPKTVFAPGSPELDHTRRHGRYVADSAREWLVALGTLLRGLLVSLGLLVGLVTVIGLLLGRFYFSVPLFKQANLPLPGGEGGQPGFPPLSGGVFTAFATLLAAGLVVWLLSVFLLTRDKASGHLRHVAQGIFAVTAAVAVLGIGVPAMVWAYVRLAWWIADAGDLEASKLVVGGSTGTVVLAYLGALVSILWRHREKVGAVRKLLAKDGTTVQRRVPKGIVQRLIVWLVLAVLAFAYGALLTAVLWMSMRASTFDALTWWKGHELSFWPQWFVVVVPVVFVLVAVFVDQTWMSLHPFYRRRLATAFAVRRRSRVADGVEFAEPYAFDRESTPLATYGHAQGHPHVIFAAAANLSGFDRTPPGRRATSYTFSHDWVGGPQVGYVRTSELTEKNLKPSLVRDLTVQSAMAVSGAAFASAMGREARAFQTLLALSNARLGTWLPNPAWLADRGRSGEWMQPRIPRVRRLTYLLREIIGSFDPADRFLLVTDGGHYENLGLVELLRHRCRTVYCIDAAGDSPPLATTLGEAISLAKEELGITITLDKPLDLVPGSSQPLSPADPLAELSARLSASVVVTGTIKYPNTFTAGEEAEESDLGRLVVAKTRLHPDMGADVLSYAQQHPTFPYDSTSDQWFDEGQFNAYHALGTFLGEAAVKAGASPWSADRDARHRAQMRALRAIAASHRPHEAGRR